MPIFGARRRAQDLESALEAIGGLDYAEVQARTRDANEHMTELLRQIAQAQAELAALRAQVIDVRQTASLQEVGIYNFAHPAEDSVALATQLAFVRASIKNAVSGGRATQAIATFTFNNSAAKGAKFVSDLSKMMLSAYNAEAENAVKTVKAGNLDTALQRLYAVAARVARFGNMINLSITPEYQQLRAQELQLTSRHMAALDAEREAERERKARLREQAKVDAEIRAERDRLNKERAHYANVLAALRERGDTIEAARIEAQLADIDKAIKHMDYRAANVRAGYVYVISNVGCMGNHMVKIGMTRRLEPMDRIKELGDASVPFPYDVHALFFADDAVNIETTLHHAFADKRVNRVNARREFFYASPAEVLDALREHQVALVEYTLEPAAEQYRLSLAAAQAETR
ncbi:MAG: DUF4041 domain-containing protein [Frankiaceae bacterium]|nr:DUF4041 domain-containing protein [Frankiaceae bacterium]